MGPLGHISLIRLISQVSPMVTKKPRKAAKPWQKPAQFKTACEIARSLPGAEESTSYGTPAFKVQGKLFARFHQDGESLVVSVDFDEREEMMAADPEKFYITDHYKNYPWILVRLAKVTPAELRDLMSGSYRRAQTRKPGQYQ